MDQFNVTIHNSSVLGAETKTEDFQWTIVAVLKTVFFSATVLLTILGNSTVLVAFAKYKKELRAPTHFFLANLAFADLLVGIFTLPFLSVFSVTLKWYFGGLLCWLWTVFHFTFCSTSILSTLCVCIERFVGVRYPLKHLRLLTNRIVLSMILCCWIIALVLTTAPILIWEETRTEIPHLCKVNFSLGHVLIATVGLFHIPASVMCILYFLIYQTVRSNPFTNVRGSRRLQGAKSNTDEQRGMEIRLAKKLSFLVGFLIFSYLPMFTMFLILGIKPGSIPLRIFIDFAWLRYINSCINPFIYAFSVPGYKRAFRQMLLKQKAEQPMEMSSKSVSTLPS